MVIPNLFRTNALAFAMLGWDQRSHLDQKPAVWTPFMVQFSPCLA
jgi:hypothetical protein